MEEISEWIEANYKDKTVLVPYWLVGWMNALNDGDNIRYYASIENFQENEGNVKRPDIIIVCFEDDTHWKVLSTGVIQWTGETYEEMCKNYKPPTKSMLFDDISVYIFE